MVFFSNEFFFKATGGVPVDRSKNHGLVDSMTLLLKESDEMIVAVPAEGTRRGYQSGRPDFIILQNLLRSLLSWDLSILK